MAAPRNDESTVQARRPVDVHPELPVRATRDARREQVLRKLVLQLPSRFAGNR